MNGNENAPAANRGANENNFNSSIAPLENLLNRLENVQKRGEGYRANCPNRHRTPGSLSISMKGDMLLMKCFAGCSPLEVLHPIGLKLSDLYERPVEAPRSLQQSREQRELMKMRRWRATRPDIQIEMSVMLSIARQASQGYPVSQEDLERAERADRLIRSALEYLE